MQYSGLQVFSFIVLLVGTAAIIGSIATTHWTTHDVGTDISEVAGKQPLISVWYSFVTATKINRRYVIQFLF